MLEEHFLCKNFKVSSIAFLVADYIMSINSISLQIKSMLAIFEKGEKPSHFEFKSSLKFKSSLV